MELHVCQAPGQNSSIHAGSWNTPGACFFHKRNHPWSQKNQQMVTFLIILDNFGPQNGAPKQSHVNLNMRTSEGDLEGADGQEWLSWAWPRTVSVFRVPLGFKMFDFHVGRTFWTFCWHFSLFAGSGVSTLHRTSDWGQQEDLGLNSNLTIPFPCVLVLDLRCSNIFVTCIFRRSVAEGPQQGPGSVIQGESWGVTVIQKW